MESLTLGSDLKGRALNILCLGAHCDDIDIGCGASLLSILERVSARVTWVACSASAERAAELHASAANFLANAVDHQVITWNFRDGFLPAQFTEVKEAFESLKSLERPDLIFTHHKRDRHQDHRTVAELTWNTFRDHLVLEYEIPKYDGGLQTPNLYVPVSEQQANRKIEILLDSYPSQRQKAWFTADTFKGLMRIRGIESEMQIGWAEGFHADKVVLNIGEQEVAL